MLPNAVPDPGWVPRSTPRAGPLKLVAVGRLSPEKDPRYFAELIGAVRSFVPEVEAVWAGDGPLRPAPEWGSGIEWVGHRSDREVGDLISDAHALVITSVTEGLPLVALQALALGIPVLSRRAGSVADAAVDGVTGAVWDASTSPSEAAAGLAARGLLSPTGLFSMEESARRHYEQNFTVDVMVSRLIDRYETWAWQSQDVAVDLRSGQDTPPS